MSEKIEFCYLVEGNNTVLITKIINILRDNGWRYNKYVLGEYTYWVDSPMWNFGNSITIKEKEIWKDDNTNKIEKIVNDISNYYSPSIILGSRWFDKDVEATVSIIENDKIWKEVMFSVDRFEIIDSLSLYDKKDAIIMLCNLFSMIAIQIKPFYGVAATEIMGVVQGSKEFRFDKETLGDTNYFSNQSIKHVNLDELMDEYHCQRYSNNDILLTRKSNLFELG